MKVLPTVVFTAFLAACNKPDAKPEKKLDYSNYKPSPSSLEYAQPRPSTVSFSNSTTAKSQISQSSFRQIAGELESRGVGDLAAILQKRFEQSHFKMKITEEQAQATGTYILDNLPSMPSSQKLVNILPKTTVELLRAVGERGVSRTDAEKIAVYLINFLEVMKLQNTKSFDENTSHVIGREWQDIDYRGEGMTWQGQKRDWEPVGVKNYKKAEYVHNYLKNAATLPYFRRIYRPQGSIYNVHVPWESQQ
ncbi:hypothetical protein JXA56_00885 [Candidatus Micrarchaeota archaeon]|nr:hypothetical protein [Candidatus Micrarchaeota archaeon]